MGSRRDQGGQGTERGACLGDDVDIGYVIYSKAITTYVLVSFCSASFIVAHPNSFDPLFFYILDLLPLDENAYIDHP